VTCLLFAGAIAAAQESQKRTENSKPDSKVEQSKQAADKAKEKPGFALSVKTNPILNISLKAEKVKLVEIAAELSKRLKTPVIVGSSLQSEVVSLEFSGLTLEPAMQLMAPAVYVDYEIETSGNTQPKPLGIYFWDANAGEPSITSSIQSSTQSMLIEGDTEDGVEPQTDAEKKKLEEQPLRIQFQENKLSVKAKKQPLALVLLKIGEELGIPVDIQFETEDTVDIEFSKLSVEDAVRKLSPNIKLFLRADLLHAERRALRIVFTDPTKTTSTGF
jgi:type II secretory pathway component GspD/PulD (secretin)